MTFVPLDLPEELFGLIIGYLPFSDRVGLSLVNRPLRERLLPYVFYQTKLASTAIDQGSMSDEDGHMVLRRHGRYACRVYCDFLQSRLADRDAFLTESLRHVPHLRRIHLRGLTQPLATYIPRYLPPSRTSHLTHLSLTHHDKYRDASNVSRSPPPSSSELYPPDRGLFRILARCPRLRFLELVGPRFRLSYPQWTQLFLYHCPQLIHLRTRACGDDNLIHAIAAALPRLVTLQLSFHEIEGPTLALLPLHCPNLRSLFMYPLPVRQNHLLETMDAQHWPRLRYLHLTGDYYERPPTDIAAIARYLCPFRHPWTNLQTLSLDNVSLGDLVWEQIATRCPQLKDVTFDGCPITDVALRRLLERLPRLERFRLRNIECELTPACLPKRIASDRLYHLAMIIKDFQPSWLFHLQPQLSHLRELVLFKFNKKPNPREVQQYFPGVTISFDS
ncbi:hypothetical protein IWQ60_010509 [Tieghemiomyces parasiticus]|uniref:F-box domain-containing protein n=1 Tax=Tieghemiomyces parasiticus TaxID=78921 RepID=A0A9W7ZJL0_9FUNG|nr:hypothetical protein IWQ60_010509 [Tieghemiomyces parasiticus]